MLIEEALYSKLSGTTAITDLVGTRIKPQMGDQADQYPAIRYEKVSGRHLRSAAGPLKLAEATIEIESWADTYAAAKAIREQIRLAIGDKGGTWGTLTIRACFLEEDADELEYAVGVDQQRKRGVRQRAEIWYFE